MNTIKTLTINGLALSLSLFLVACGGGGSDSGGSGGSGGSSGGTGGGTGATNNKPIAVAGDAIDITKTFTVNLDGSGSSDADSGDSLSFTWTQTRGTDVTGGSGSLSGETPAFAAPDNVETLVFELVVNDGTEDSDPSTVVVNIFEDINVTYFVDGDNGDDSTGTGSRDNPFASLAKAITELTSNQEDIYVKTLDNNEAYDETASTLNIPSGTSVYGGYDADWVRDVETFKTMIDTDHNGFQFFSVTQDAWLSGFDVVTNDSPDATDDVYGVYAVGDGSANFYMHDNSINNGDVSNGEDYTPGSNYGVLIRSLAFADIRSNDIFAGASGDGINGNSGDDGDDGDDGNDGNTTKDHRAAGGNTGLGGNGGSGGDGGTAINENGGGGAKGGDTSRPLGGTTTGGSGGSGGSGNVADGGSAGDTGNTGGRGIPGSSGQGAGSLTSSIFYPSNGNSGGRGGHGSGGGGGGGGEANDLGYNGGGGGGGGEGGEGGYGGFGGRGAGASIGVWLHAVTSTEIIGNTILSGQGGLGNRGGYGGLGGSGGSGGSGVAGNDGGLLGRGGGGANGRNGGSGGSGGYGGAGGGGPSYGVIFASGMEPNITGNTITSGDGGDGGNGGFRGNGGQGGYSYAIYDRDTSDAFFATLSQNSLASGFAGNGGTSSENDGSSAGSDGESASKNWN